MKKLFLVALLVLSLLTCAFAEGMAHYDTTCGYGFDYDESLLVVVDELGTSVTMIACDDDTVASVSLIACTDCTPDAAPYLCSVAAEFGLDVPVDAIDVLDTAAGGKAYRLTIEDEFGARVEYIVQEAGREVDISLFMDEEAGDAMKTAAEQIALSLAMNPEGDFSGFDVTEEDLYGDEYELDFYDAMLDGYETMLTKYGAAVQENWDMDTLFENDLLPTMALVEDKMQLAHEIKIDFLDLACVGRYQMVLYTLDEDDDMLNVLAIYSKDEADNDLTVVVASERSMFKLAGNSVDGYVLLNYGSSSAAQSGYFFYDIAKDGTINFKEAVVFDSAANEAEPWFLAHDLDWDTSNDQPISQEEASSIVYSYTYDEPIEPLMSLGEYIELFMTNDQ